MRSLPKIRLFLFMVVASLSMQPAMADKQTVCTITPDGSDVIETLIRLLQST